MMGAIPQLLIIGNEVRIVLKKFSFFYNKSKIISIDPYLLPVVFMVQILWEGSTYVGASQFSASTIITYYSCVSTVLVPYIFYYTAVIIKWASTLLSPNNKYIEIIEINQLRADSEAEENSVKTASTIAISLTRWEN